MPRKCTRCQESRPLTEFHKNSQSRDGISNICKTCRSLRYKEVDYPKRRSLVNTSDYRSVKSAKYRRLYGISIEDAEHLLHEQGNCCAICRLNVEASTHPFCVDHDHESGAIRGVLCRDCNLALGMFKDDPIKISNALNYLSKMPIEHERTA